MTNHVRDLNNSRPLDVHKWSDYPEVDRFVNQLWNQYLHKHFPEGDAGQQKAPKKAQFKVLLLDLYACWLEDPQQCLAVSMTRNFYKTNSRYNALHISPKVIEIIKHLAAEKLIGLKEGVKGFYGHGFLTRIWPSTELITLFEDPPISPEMIETHWMQECIVLNKKGPGDRKAKPIEYKDTDHPRISDWRKNVQKYNDLMQKVYVDIYDLDEPWTTRTKERKGKTETVRIHINQSRKFSRRIFYRGSWELGGRLHGGFWQLLNKEMRAKILIEHTPTVEIDFSGMHVSIAYSLEGKEPPKNPYKLEKVLLQGYSADEQRKVVKQLILMAINADNEGSACKAFRDEQPSGSREKSLNDRSLKMLLDQFKKEHSPVAAYLCSDRGAELMNYDGEIAYRVICRLTEQEIPVLCIHDSFIIKHTEDKKLLDVIKEEVSNFLNKELHLDRNRYGLGSAEKYFNDYITRETEQDYSYLKEGLEQMKSDSNYMKRYDKWLAWRWKDPEQLEKIRWVIYGSSARPSHTS